DRTVVPNDFIVELSTPDFERLSPYSGQLGDELAGMERDYAKQQRYTFMGPIKVHLEKADDLDTGLYRVRSRTLASSASQAPGAPGAGPAPAGRPGGYGYPPAAPAGAPPMRPPPPPRRARHPASGRPGARPAPGRPPRRLRLPAGRTGGRPAHACRAAARRARRRLRLPAARGRPAAPRRTRVRRPHPLLDRDQRH